MSLFLWEKTKLLANNFLISDSPPSCFSIQRRPQIFKHLPLLPSPPASRGFIYSLFWSGPHDESLHSSLSDTHNLWLLPCQSLVLDQPTHQPSPPALNSLSSLKKAYLQGREQSQYTEWQRGVCRGEGVCERERQTDRMGRGRET